MTQDFDMFFVQRRLAADAYVRGDGARVLAMLPESGNATFHGPGGDTVVGAIEVARRYGTDAASFGPGGTSKLEVLQIGSDDSLGFWTGFQIATLRVPGQSDNINMRIRVTEVFRKIDGAWKLIHRHADSVEAN